MLTRSCENSRRIEWVVLASIAFAACERAVAVPNLFMYSFDDVQTELIHTCQEARVWTLRRNGDGRKLYCTLWCEEGVRVLVRGGVEQLLKAPGSDQSFLDESGRFVAWSDDPRLGFRFSNGFFRTTAWKDGAHGTLTVDPSGRYYSVALAPERTVIASMNQPDVVIHESRFHGAKLFYQGGKPYLFGRSSHWASGEQEIQVEIIGRQRNGWALERALTIPRGLSAPSPFYVVDMDPSAERVLVVDERDLPFGGKLYLYDLASETRLQVQGHVHPYMLFLERDLLKDSPPARN